MQDHKIDYRFTYATCSCGWASFRPMTRYQVQASVAGHLQGHKEADALGVVVREAQCEHVTTGT